MMFKNIKYILASLFVACFMVACGGGGGSSSPNGNNGVGNLPPESQPIESTPESSPQSTETLVNITSSGFSSTNANQVVAGQSFKITATVTSGSGATINFSNAYATPSSVTYSPQSCEISQTHSCTTTVTVGLGTPNTTSSAYAVQINSQTSGVILSATHVSFTVSTPALILSKQPNPTTIAVNGMTSVGVTIAPGSIPSGTGKINVILGGYPLSILDFNPESCVISYTQGKITSSTINDCQNVEVTANNIGSDQIVALANGFTGVSSNQINVVYSGNLPYVVLTTTLPQPGYSIAAGQEFEITAISHNGAAALINFTNSANTPGSITNNNSSCQLTANGSCTTRVTVPLGTTPVSISQGYAIDVNFTNTTELLANQTVKFGVYTPKLKFAKNLTDNSDALLLGKTVNREITIDSSSIPAGKGSISIALGQNNPGIITYPQQFSSCNISYADNQIISNTCKSLVYGNTQGNTIIQASSQYFENAYDHMTVTPFLMYVAEGGGHKISMYSAYAGVLTLLNKSVDNLYAPSAITHDVSGQFLYAVNKNVDRISMYFINPATGELSALDPFLVSTGLQPSSIAINPNGSYLYVTNYGSSTIGVYKINASNGQLTLTYTATTGTNPSAVTVDPSGKFVYVANTGSKSISPFSINANGSLTGVSLPVTLNATPAAVAVEPTGNYLYIPANNGSIITYTINKTTGALYSPVLTTNTAGTPSGITIDVLGKFAYVTSNLGNNVTVYSITAQTPSFTGGQLNYVSSIKTGTKPWSLMLDPTGQYAYVTNNSSNSVSMYSVNQASGFLKALDTPTVATGPSPMGISFSPGN